jgi:hypothetical protein
MTATGLWGATARVPVPGADTPVGDVVTAIVWAALAVGSIALVARLPRDTRGAWLVVAIYCCVVAVDKVVDLQMAAYHTAKWIVDATQPVLGLREHVRAVRLALMVALIALGVGGTVLMVRRDRELDVPRKLAIAGLLLIIAMVGARLVPGSPFDDVIVDWVVEGVGCACVAAGLVLGWRTTARPRLTK